jgi:hypothetical protein
MTYTVNRRQALIISLGGLAATALGWSSVFTQWKPGCAKTPTATSFRELDSTIQQGTTRQAPRQLVRCGGLEFRAE